MLKDLTFDNPYRCNFIARIGNHKPRLQDDFIFSKDNIIGYL
ncbi:hypothetical protein HanRHA438_Chr10g0458621 [Helianthus annuus]|nr:hypothetical protein HanPI659440_Chr10g0383591 [Helianthus annuus]KAJ0880042.1 hypothetical protein HanRHA438_Chr10g0458621 [Helianthus annuus]